MVLGTDEKKIYTMCVQSRGWALQGNVLKSTAWGGSIQEHKLLWFYLWMRQNPLVTTHQSQTLCKEMCLWDASGSNSTPYMEGLVVVWVGMMTDTSYCGIFSIEGLRGSESSLTSLQGMKGENQR